jgi:hypothetical protein
MLLVLALLPGAPAAARTDGGTYRLRPGQSTFWSGTSGSRSGEPVDYRIVVTGRATRLRIAIDQGGGAIAGNPSLELVNPAGEVVESAYPIYSAEIRVDRPAAGTWLARVVPGSGSTPFRMRARLDVPTAAPKRPKALLPNLRMLPPFELTFSSDTIGFPPAGMVGLPNGCFVDEVVNYQASRCLRFSTGPGNIGEGNLLLHFEPSATVASGNVMEEIAYTDGSSKLVPAGKYIYHAGHLHFHHAGFGGFDLLKVSDPKRGGLSLVGHGPKMGFCMDDYVIVNWKSFANGAEHTVGRNCAGSGDNPAAPMYTGLTQGWADVYAFYQEGMFIDFGNNPDGLYVVRIKANANDSIVESNHKDNFSYALIQVTGDVVKVLERGFGQSPWDPAKTVATDMLPPNPLSPGPTSIGGAGRRA